MIFNGCTNHAASVGDEIWNVQDTMRVHPGLSSWDRWNIGALQDECHHMS
jgi:hypothetical protein